VVLGQETDRLLDGFQKETKKGVSAPDLTETDLVVECHSSQETQEVLSQVFPDYS
jgi:hypothetical protein